MKPTSATDAVRQYLKKNKSITQLQALEKFGTWRLSRIISDLRKQGLYITTRLCKVKTRYGKKTEVAKYLLK